MTSGWGTGKTMFAILKGVRLSGLYPGNKGLILRKNLTDLHDSTMSDFIDYTRGQFKIKSQHKTCRIPIKGYPDSEIIFHHVDELAGVIQNINLGWFFIEQAEELDTDEVFEKLGGRLRRVLTPIREIQEKLIALGKLKKVVSDFRELGYEETLIAESAIITDLKIPLRQGIIIANANGHNWNWRKFINKGGSECLLGREFNVVSKDTGKIYSYGDLSSLVEATTFDNEDNLPADFMAAALVKKEMSPSMYRRFVLNSHEDMDTADACIPYEHLIRAVNANIFCLHDKRRLVCCDPAEMGNDRTVIMALEEAKIIDLEVLRKKEPMETAGRIVRMMRRNGAKKAVIDSIGIGAGIRSRLSELGIDVQGINVGRKSDNPEDFKRVKGEVWMNAQEMFRENLVSLLDNDELIEELAAHRYTANSSGQVIMEKSSDTQKRLGGKSPDLAAAFVLGLYGLKGMDYEPVIEQEEVDSDLAESYSVKTVF